jgi:DNA primase
MARVDVDAIRAAHPIEDVVAASGVELRSSGRAFMARCPFHVEDRHPSMSVGGVTGRYHCFACGAGGDVIDYVARFNGIGFRDAADRLTANAAFTGRIPAAIPLLRRTTDGPVLDRTSATRIFQINQLAWRYFTERPNLERAERYMMTERRIDVRAIRSETDGQPVVGYAPSTWRRLSDTLLREGATPDELVDADLASRRDYRLIDTFRGRVIVPLRDSLGQIEGFIGRDVTGEATAAKYRNPTKTATFDKSRALYRPTRHLLDPEGQAIVVEGVMDALAVTAAAAATDGTLNRFAACTTSGITVSRVQAIKVVAISANPVIIALDGDQAGAEGTARWLSWVETTIGRSAVPVRLPDGVDPAEWLATHGVRGLEILVSDGGGLDRTNTRSVESISIA